MAAVGRDSAGLYASAAATGVEAALPPQLPPSLTPPTLPLLLPCTPSSLPAAVRSAYRCLGELAGWEDTPLVVLCAEYHSIKVIEALLEEGTPVHCGLRYTKKQVQIKVQILKKCTCATFSSYSVF